MISSKFLADSERNTTEYIFDGQNAPEIWGGLPAVLLFGDDYQLMLMKNDGAVNGYTKRQLGAE